MIILICMAAESTGIKGKIHPSKHVLKVRTDPPPDYHSLPLFACAVMQAKTESAV